MQWSAAPWDRHDVALSAKAPRAGCSSDLALVASGRTSVVVVAARAPESISTPDEPASDKLWVTARHGDVVLTTTGWGVDEGVRTRGIGRGPRRSLFAEGVRRAGPISTASGAACRSTRRRPKCGAPCSTNRAPSARSTCAGRIAAESDSDGDIAVAVSLANSGRCAAQRIVPRSLGGHAACLLCRAWRDALRSRGRRS